MTSRSAGRGSLLLLAGLACTGVGDNLGVQDTGAPRLVTASPLAMSTVLVTWAPAAGAVGYRVERRENLAGPFTPIGDVTPGTDTSYNDNGTQAETIYGYRVRALAPNGTYSEPSLVVGTVTPPRPSIVLSTSLIDPQYIDADGVTIQVIQPAGDTARVLLTAADTRLLSPLPTGRYRLTLQQLAANCVTPDSVTRDVQVTDQGVDTRRQVAWRLNCRAPDRGRLRVGIQTAGDSLDADGYVLTVSGIASDVTLPDSLRGFLSTGPVAVNPVPSPTFDNLRPGTYTIRLTGIQSNCALTGPAERQVDIVALTDTLVSYRVDCVGAGDNPTLPFVWRNSWSDPAPAPGKVVSLDVTVDLTAQPAQSLNSVQAQLEFDSTVVRFDSATKVGGWNLTTTSINRGRLSWLSFVTGLGETGAPKVARFWFTVIGAAGTTTVTRSTLAVAGDLDGNDLLAKIRRQEATLTVGTGGSGNQPPTARPGGPYAGSAGIAVTFNGSASSDADGTIANYAWSFGDGGTGSGASPSHTYGAAGTYTVTLAVTDNNGATASATTTATISAGGGNQPPVSRPGGPYAGTAGVAVSFNGTGSSDPDGSIANYSWTFGDGSVGTGSTISHIYSAAGTYTATLTVTDNQGATGSASVPVTVTSAGGSGQAFWTSQFGAINPADSLVSLTITLDLTRDIAATPGAEEIATWVVDSLKWDPTLLQYFSFSFGASGSGSVNPTNAAQGKLLFSGAVPSGNGTGLVTLATIRYKVIGASGRSVTTATRLGPLIGSAATGFFSYTSLTAVQEGTLLVP